MSIALESVAEGNRFEFNAHSVKRIEAIGNDIAKTLDGLDKSKTRFVK